MPDNKDGNDLGVFDDLLKKKEQERLPSQPLLAAPVPMAAPPNWFGAPADPPAATEGASSASEPAPQGSPSISPILAPTDPVDDGGWDEGSANVAAKPIAAKEEAAPAPAEAVVAASAEPAPIAAPAPTTAPALAATPALAAAPAPTATPAPTAAPAPASWGEDLIPVARSSKVPAPPGVRLSGVPLPPPPSSRLPQPPNRLSSIPKLAPPPTVGSSGAAASSLAPGSLAPPVLTASAFTSPLGAPPPPPPPRMSVPGPTSGRASAPVAVAVEVAAPRRLPSKQAMVIAATLVAGIVLGFAVRGSGGSTSGNATATLKAAAGQPGVKLLIDGREVGALPREVSGLTPGEHLIALEGDRYAPTKKVVIFGPNEVKELDPERLKVVRGAATFDVKTPGATLVLVTDDERRELSDYSLPVDIDATKSWTLEASKAGYETLRMPVTFGDQTAKTFAVTLGQSQKAQAALPETTSPEPRAQAAASPAEPSKVADTTPAAHKASPADAPKAETSKADPPKAQSPAGSCKLNVNSIPVSKILLDGRPIGLTPKVGVVVPAGTHTVVFVGENGRKSTSSACQPGETKAVSMHL